MNLRSIKPKILLNDPRKKLNQSQSPQRYYEFLVQNTNRQADKSVQLQRSSEQTPDDFHTEKKEEFKMEIERRFRKAAENPPFRMPRYDDSTLSSEELLSDSSVESLERLSHSVKYDLNSQNLRMYAKLEAILSDYEAKQAQQRKESKQSGATSSSHLGQKTRKETPKKLLGSPKNTMNIPQLQVLRLEARESPKTKRKLANNPKTELSHHQTPPLSLETATTTDTLPNQTTKPSSKMFPPALNVNLIQRKADSIDERGAGLQQSQSVLRTKRRIGEPQQGKITLNLSSRSPALKLRPLGVKIPVAQSSDRLKRTVGAGFRSPNAHNVTDNIEGRIHGLSQLNATEIHKTPCPKVLATPQIGAKLVVGQNQGTSTLYQKTKNELLRKLKPSLTEFVNNSTSSKVILKSTGLKDTPTGGELNTMKSISIRSFISPRAQNQLKIGSADLLNLSEQKAEEPQHKKITMIQSISVSPKRYFALNNIGRIAMNSGKDPNFSGYLIVSNSKAVVKKPVPL